MRRPDFSSPGGALLLGLSLVSLGFVVGYGFHTSQSPPRIAPQTQSESQNEEGVLTPPVAKALRVSPDGRTLAFTGVYDRARRASRFLLDLKSGKWSATETPRGWQDYTMQWSSDGRRVLFDREKIPRNVEETSAGLYAEDIDRASVVPRSRSAEPVAKKGVLPPGEKTIAGFWSDDGALVVKTRREPKALFEIKNDRARLIDRAAVTYGQNRAVLENGRTVFYVVRDLPDAPRKSALFRVDGQGVVRRLSTPLEDVEWTYVAEDARWMIVCRTSTNGTDWNWTLHRVTGQSAPIVTARDVPGDVIGVFWSPDRKHILGASGKSLWIIDIPTLQSRRLGKRTDWNADDAAWMIGEKSVLVTAAGKLWKAELGSGEAKEIWQFPESYWK